MSGPLFGDWNKLSRLLDRTLLGDAVESAFGEAIGKNSELLRRNIVVGIRNQRPEWPDIQEATKRRKGSSKILIDSGEMMGAVRTKQLTKVSAFVGIPAGVRNKRRKGGRMTIAEYGAKHEFGMAVKSGGGARIVKRQFIKPAYDESFKPMEENFFAAGKKAITDVLR